MQVRVFITNKLDSCFGNGGYLFEYNDVEFMLLSKLRVVRLNY